MFRFRKRDLQIVSSESAEILQIVMRVRGGTRHCKVLGNEVALIRFWRLAESLIPMKFIVAKSCIVDFGLSRRGGEVDYQNAIYVLLIPQCGGFYQTHRERFWGRS